MKHRIVVALIALAMVLSLAACGDTPSSTPAGGGTAAPGAVATPATVEPEGLAPYEIVYTLLSNETYSDIGLVEEAINAQIQPLINATIKFRQGTWGDWEERALLPIQSGEKADLVFTADWYHYTRCIDQNIIIPLNDPNSSYGDLLNAYAPDAVRLLGDAFIEGVEVDGIAYGVPTNKELTVPRGFQWNATLVEKYDIDIDSVQSEEDLNDILAMVKEGEGANFYPVLTNGGWMEPFISMASSANFSDAVMLNDRLPDGSDDMTIYWRWEHPDTIDHLDIRRDWYLKGYINPDAHLSTYTESDDRFAGNFLVACGKALTFEGNDAAEMMAASGNPDLRLVDKIAQEARQLTTHAGGSLMSIPITSGDPARAMMLLNLMHSNTDVINTMVFGVEGKNYTHVSDGVVQTTEDSWYGVHAGPWIFGNQYIQWTTTDDGDPQKYEKLRAFSQSGIPHPSLGFRFRGLPVENEIAAYNNVTSGMSRALNCGAVDPKVELPRMVEALRTAGADKIMEEVRTQFTTWYEATK